MKIAVSCLAATLAVAPLSAATYWVDNGAANASDDNAGTADQPWRTIGRAGSAAELQPGDTVLIRTGVYREYAEIKVSGEANNPITFAAAPGAKVVIKGSEIVHGPWTRLTDLPDKPEPFPNAYGGVWSVKLGDEYFTDPRFEGSYADPAQRWVSQVFIDDTRALQRIGAPRIYKDEGYPRLSQVGRGLDDLIYDSFFFDPADQTLYLKIAGNPAWYSIEVGVRGFALTAVDVHDVVIRGLELRHNRQPGGQWPLASLNNCQRARVEDCRFEYADFCGFSLYKCADCIVSRCELSHNGDTGYAMSLSENCLIEDCRLLFNNYRHFMSGWAAGGMKCIPGNKHCTIRGCEAAYNLASDGIWFDSENEDIQILGNVSHHNGGCGIFYEINPGGGVIADNLVYANQGRGIYLSGSQHVWVVHNTVAFNGAGIVVMPREDPFTVEHDQILNNLLIGNYTAAANVNRGCDLTLFMGPRPDTFERTGTTCHSDYNVYANGAWTPTMRHHWNPDNTLEQWRERFGEDQHSTLMAVEAELRGTGFRLLTADGLDIAGPLPAEVGWQPEQPRRVGASRTQWP